MGTVARWFWSQTMEFEGSLVTCCLLVERWVFCLYQKRFNDKKSTRIIFQTKNFGIAKKYLQLNLKKCEDDLVLTKVNIDETSETVRDSILNAHKRETVFTKLREIKQSAEGETL